MRISDWSSDVCSSDLAIWRDIMALANGVDPAHRAQRVSLLMRQVAGMTETEGSSAAHRLTMSLIDEAMQDGPRFGFEVRSEEHTSELQSLMRTWYAVVCLKQYYTFTTTTNHITRD